VDPVIIPPPIASAEYCDERVCLSVCVCVCPRSHLRNYYTSDLHQIFVHVTYGRGSVIHWRRSDTLRISGVVDDVIFAHKLTGCSTRRRQAEAVRLTRTQSVKYPLQAADARDYFLQSAPTRPQWAR